MKRMVVPIVVACLLFACNESNREDEAELKDPTETQPVSDAIPDSMKLVNDSVIVPDVNAGNGSHTGRSDSAQRRKQ